MDTNINDINEEYTIIQKTQVDILKEVTNDNDERLIYEAIITNLEKDAADAIRKDKVVSLPNIGCIRKSPFKKIINSKFHAFRAARKNMNKEEYKSYVREVVNDAKEKQRNDDITKLALNRIRRNNKKTYDNLFINIGRAYAELFILSIFWLKEVPYNEEVQQHFDSLNKDNE